MNKELVISIQDCSFSYTKIPILKNLNLSIHRSDKIALIGKNGVGKSTLMEILSRERSPDAVNAAQLNSDWEYRLNRYLVRRKYFEDIA